MSDFEKVMNDVEELLKNEKPVTSISRIDNNLEMFMEDEKIPIITQIKILEDPNSIDKYESFMKYKVGHDPQHHFSLNILRAKTPEALVRIMIDNYEKRMKDTLGKVRKGFKRDIERN